MEIGVYTFADVSPDPAAPGASARAGGCAIFLKRSRSRTRWGSMCSVWANIIGRTMRYPRRW